MEEYSVRFWNNLERLTKEKGVSWSALARELKIDRVSLMHTKSRHNLPRVERLLLIAEILEVSLDDLLNI